MPFDLAVVGAGIVGLAHALAAARRGLRVVLIDRSPRAEGASIRNFGMVWPIGQPAGPLLDRARRSRETWLHAAREAGFWISPCGSLHAARHEDEWAVLREFAAASRQNNRAIELLSPADACTLSPGLRFDGLVGAMHSLEECAVDPREAIRAIPAWLARAHAVDVRLGSAVTHAEPGALTLASGERLDATRIIIAAGHDFHSLLPGAFARSGLRPCKLQMLRTRPQAAHTAAPWRLGPHLAAGLTLLHYRAFETCPSLSAVRDRLARQHPDCLRLGIHVMVSQNALGELTIGDSHEYGDAIEPFDHDHIDRLILDYLGSFFSPPDPAIAQRWHGIYAKAPAGATEFVVQARPNVWVVTGLGGAGMTLSFGLAEEVLPAVLGEAPPPASIT
ncbi:MAG: TIGR03364 family FAD-dependent oxidoreductase [Phycisphaerae bacterium]|nr:TIGR03364 family FAD-dependent oxidoreductase [Phycisphaerae bacterium]